MTNFFNYYQKHTIAYLAVIVLCCLSHLSAQDKQYIETFEDYWIPNLSIINRSIRLNIRPIGGNPTQDITYQPNVVGTGGLGMVFKRVALRVGFKLAQDPQANTQLGQSKYFDIQLHSFGKKLVFDAYYQDYLGYYIANPREVFGIWNSPRLPQRGDLDIFHVGGNATYIFNSDRFSYRGVFTFDEAQRKSAGSLLMTASLTYTQVNADSSLVPSNNRLNFPENAQFSRANLYNLAVMPGYAYTAVLNKQWYLSLSLSALLGLRYQQYGLQQISSRDMVLSFRALGRVGLGYNGRRFFGGASLHFDTQTAQMAQTQTGTTTLSVNITTGYRFRTRVLEGYRSIWQWMFGRGRHKGS